MMNENAFTSWTPLYTQRLVLRQPGPDDAAAIFRLRTDEKVNAMIGRKAPADINGAIDFIHQTNQNILKNQGLYWAVCLHAELTGTICLFHFDRELNHAEVGFELLPEFRGKGIMQESFTAVREFAFEQLGLNKLIAVVNPNNENSLSFLRKNQFLPAISLAIDKAPNDLVFILPNPVQAEP
jgi:[ribosomal protein S5]-alanine N-acetyltransferase